MPTYLILLIAFLEGFTTLSVEIIALRNFTPIIGSNSIATSIVLGVILLALSYGYYIGGKFSYRYKEKLPKMLFMNLIIAGIYYCLISFTLDQLLLDGFLNLSGNYFFSILAASIILFALPVFLASQTIPLLSELMKGNHSGEKMGKLLFFSTIGSFLGSVGTSSFFFPLIGVYKSSLLSPLLLTLCAMILSLTLLKEKKYLFLSSTLFIFYILIGLAQPLSQNLIFSEANAYHSIEIKNYPERNLRVLHMDKAFSSGISLENKQSFFSYIQEAEKQVQSLRPKNILVIGAAGFTFPRDVSTYDFVERIDVIDVDPSLQEISEKYFLEEMLSEKIHFFPQDARYFLRHPQLETYDLILVDAYSGQSIPPQILTKEFFKQVGKTGSVILYNFILDRSLESTLSQSIIATMQDAGQSVFMKDVNNGTSLKSNIMLSNTALEGYIPLEAKNTDIYTDNKHRIELDMFLLDTQEKNTSF